MAIPIISLSIVIEFVIEQMEEEIQNTPSNPCTFLESQSTPISENRGISMWEWKKLQNTMEKLFFEKFQNGRLTTLPKVYLDRNSTDEQMDNRFEFSTNELL